MDRDVVQTFLRTLLSSNNMSPHVISRFLGLPQPPKRMTRLYDLDEIDFTPYLTEMETMWEFGENDALKRFIKHYIKTLYLDDKCFKWIQERGLDKIKRHVYEFKLGDKTLKLANTSPKKVKSLFKKMSLLKNVTELYQSKALVAGLDGQEEINEMQKLYKEIMWLINKGVFLRITDNFQFDITNDSIMIRNDDTKYLHAIEYHFYDWMELVDNTIQHAQRLKESKAFFNKIMLSSIFLSFFLFIYFSLD